MQDGRNAVENSELLVLQDAREKLKRLEKKAGNKVIKA